MVPHGCQIRHVVIFRSEHDCVIFRGTLTNKLIISYSVKHILSNTRFKYQNKQRVSLHGVHLYLKRRRYVIQNMERAEIEKHKSKIGSLNQLCNHSETTPLFLSLHAQVEVSYSRNLNCGVS